MAAMRERSTTSKAEGPSWVRWRLLPPEERHDTLRAFVVVRVVRLALRIRGFQRTLRDVQTRTFASPPAAGDHLVIARQLARAVRRAAVNGPFRGNCLSRSLALLWLLRNRGIEADLRLGVRTSEGRLEAHAWVEKNGMPINDSVNIARQYSPLEARASSSDSMLWCDTDDGR